MMNPRIFATALLLSIISTVPVYSQQSIVDQFEVRSQSFGGTTLGYRLFVPAGYDSTQAYPLVLALHGAGERGTDNEVQIRLHRLATSWADPVNQAVYPAFVVAPQVPPNLRWSAEQPVDLSALTGVELTTLDILDSLETEFNIDPNRVYITGLSMGGHGTWDLISRLPNRFAAAIPMSGNADPTQADQIMHIPIWAFHGESDTVVPASGSRGIIYQMENMGRDVLYTDCQRSLPLEKNFDCPTPVSNDVIRDALARHADMIFTATRSGGHGPWTVWYDHPLLNDWLFSQYRVDQDALTIASPAGGEEWSASQAVAWTFSGAATDTVEVWLSLDNGSTWEEVERVTNGSGVYTLDTTPHADTPFARVQLFVKNEAGFVYGRQTSNAFTINNAGDAAPFLVVDDEDIRFSERLTQAALMLPILAADPEGQMLETTVLFSMDEGQTFMVVADTTLISSMEPQTLRIELDALPNTSTAVVRVEVDDGASMTMADTAPFVKDTAREVNETVVHLEGEGAGQVRMHFVDPARLTGHRYQLTFTDGTPKTYTVQDLDEVAVVLEGIPLSDGIAESPLFDGLRLVVEDLPEGAPDLENTGWTTGNSDLGITIAGGEATLALQTVQLLETEIPYEIVFAGTVVDTSQALFALPAQEMQFMVRGREDGLQREVLYKDVLGDGRPSLQDLLYILEPDEAGAPGPAWEIRFSSSSGTAFPEDGDVFLFTPLKKLSSEDVFEFTAAQGVAVEHPHEMEGFGLQSIYPNPFTDKFAVAYTLQTPARVSVVMYDMLGREVAQIFAGEQPPGDHVFNMNPEVFRVSTLASGAYMVRFSVHTVQGDVFHQTLPVTRVR